MTSSSPLTLSSLPSELLHQILVRCEPSDLAALSGTNRSLHDYIKDATQLWKEMYLSRWDTYQPAMPDQLVNSTCPSTSSVTIVNPETINLAKKLSNTSFDHAKQVQRRTWAEKRLAALQDRPIDLYANYNETLRSLLSIARSRSQRKDSRIESDTGNTDNNNNPHIGSTADYLTNLLTSPETVEIFRKAIYPRPDVKSIRQWQLKNLSEQREKRKTAIKREEKRARSITSGSPTNFKRSKRNHSLQGENEGSSSNDVLNNTLLSPPKRRSARVQLHAYPTELHHLLYDKGGNNLITLDDGTGLANLEALELIDEQLAAQLHVLHGIHPGFRTSNEKRSNNHSTSRPEGAEPASGHESESDDPDFSDHGSIPEEEEDEEVSDTQEEEGEDPDEMHNNIFRFFINQMDTNRRPREPALGSSLGHHGNLQLRGRAREIVYDTARYGIENSFGPLRAWRERYIGIDGPRFRSAQDPEDWEDGEGEEGIDYEATAEGRLLPDGRILLDDGNIGVTAERYEMEMAERDRFYDENGRLRIEESSSEAEDENEEEDNNDEDLPRRPEEAENEEEAHNHEGVPIITIDDDTEDEEDEDEEAEALFGIRALAISMSRGCLPCAEAAQLSGKIDKQHAEMSSAIEYQRGETRLSKVWRMEKRVDWVILESIMIVMYCNIRHAVLNHAWGKAFRLPGLEISLVGRDRFAGQIYQDNEQSRNSYNPDQAWKRVLGLPVGWDHTRGTIDERRPHDSNDSGNQSSSSGKEKPFDWAHVESTWIGTYAFLDWTKWASFNARDPISRGLPDPRLNHRFEAPDVGPFPYGHCQGSPNLEGEREALGDCLQLRLELLPIEDQKPFQETDRLDNFFEGYDDEMMDEMDGDSNRMAVDRTCCQEYRGLHEYPILRFHGHTRTYIDEGEPIPRGECYGSVRPIYETDDHDPELTKRRPNRRKDVENKDRAIVALHWEITHRYDGEDAWSLSGVQAGPPGTQSPIYGIWGSAQRRDNMSPCGPFAYYRVDDRKWKDFDEEERRNRRTV